MSNTTSETRKYKGVTYRVRKHWSGSTTAVVFLYGEAYHFDSIKAAKSFINTTEGK